MKHERIETRSALEIRSEPENNDALAAATAAVEEMRTAAEARHTAHQNETRALQDRIAAMETRLNRPGTQQEQREEPAAEQRAFNSFARYGVERMQAEEVRALTVSVDTAGGYLAPEQFINELDRNLVEFSPIREVARVTSVSAGELILPKRTGTMHATWTSETGDTQQSEPTYGQQKISVFELRTYVDVSNMLLEDSAFDLENELAYDFAEEFGRAEGEAFMTGDGSGKPKGLLETTGIEVLDYGDRLDITADNLIDLYHALPTTYARRATWAMNRRTIGAVRKLKNNSGSGDYLWQDALTAGNPPTILGRPVIEMPDMDDLPEEAGEGSFPVVFGDFSSGFRIFDRKNLVVLRDPYSVQTKGLVRFHGRRRVGGAVTKPDAFKILKITK
jgi:HK97 family phage major capsid protein